MKNASLFKAALFCGTAGMAGLVPQAASAQWLVTDPGAYARMIYEGVQNRIALEAQTLARNLHLTGETDRSVEAMRQASGQATVNSTRQIQAEAQMRDTADAREVQRRVQDAQVRALNDTRSGAVGCNIVTGLMGSSGLFAQVRDWRTQMTRVSLDYMGGSSSSTRASLGKSAAIEERIQAICATNATQEYVDAGACPVVTQTDQTNSVSDAVNADILMSNSTLSKAQMDAMKLFLSTALVSNPLGAMAPNEAKTAQGRAAFAQRQTATGRQSVAISAFSNILASRTPRDSVSVTDGGGAAGPDGAGGNVTTLKDWAEGTAARMLGYGPAGTNFPNGVSLQSWIEVRARSFYLDPNFALRINSQDAAQNSKDAVLIQGFQTFLQYETYREMQQMNLTLATMLSIMEEGARGETGQLAADKR